ncbi:MAG: hypothetical protein CSA95_05000 [Bacteroidetes bacterium]|nr:MAG: hypothetical protein CSA95_05000 [Bacteroidota bacterium]
MKQGYVILAIFLLIQQAFGQDAKMQERYDYAQKYYKIAVKKMHEHGIPASITLAQGILESGCGKSELAVEAYNHFGIKCHKEWTGEAYYMDDDAPNECFRKYETPEDSYEDHSLFLTTRDRYAFLFSYKKDDYKRWARGLKKAGYATNPEYANMLIRIIEETGLDAYDKMLPGTEEVASEPESTEEEVTAVQDEVAVAAEAASSSAGHRLLPDKADYQVVKYSDRRRPVYTNNGVLFIFAEAGDTFFSVAEEFVLYSFQIYKYNELKKTDVLQPGEMVYLQRKKRKSFALEHEVLEGESLRSISQFYGIRLKSLQRINGLERGASVVPGTVLRLR